MAEPGVEKLTLELTNKYGHEFEGILEIIFLTQLLLEFFFQHPFYLQNHKSLQAFTKGENCS